MVSDGSGQILNANFFRLSALHYFGEGWSGGLRLTASAIEHDQGQGMVRRISGWGETQVTGAYDFSAIWGATGYRPNLTMNVDLILPTGTEGVTGGAVGDKVPPTLLATGASAFTMGARLQLTQHLHRNLALIVPLSVNTPLQRTPSGLIRGVLGTYGLSVLGFVDKKWTISGGLAGRSMGQTTGANDDKFENSGGHFLNAEIGSGFRVNDVLSLGASVQIPLYRKVNGQQVTETLTFTGLLGYTFGKVEQDHDHRDCDHHDHKNATTQNGHGHAHDDHGHAHDDHGHAHDDHGHAHDDHGHAHEPHSSPNPGDFKEIATGGNSFKLKDVLAPGKFTVIDYWAEWCPPCKEISAYLKKLATQFPNLAVRKVEVPDFDSKAAKDHLPGIKGLPVVRIYSPEGQLLHDLLGVKSWQLEPILEPILSAKHTKETH